VSIVRRTISSGDILTEAGSLSIAITDEFENKSEGEITLTAVAVHGLESLENLQLQVDQEVNLLEGLTIAEGLTLQKVKVEQDGEKSELSNPEAYTPEYPGTVSIILTLARADGSTIEVKVDNLSIK